MGTFNPNSKIWTNTVNSYSYPLDLFYGEKLLCALDETPDRVLQINHEEGTSHTCEEIKIASIRVAQNLQRLGIETDNVIGFICRNSSTVISLVLGCVLIGAPVNPVHITFSKSKIQEIFEQTKPVLVFCDFDVLEITRNALKEINSNAMIYTLLKKVQAVPFINELLIPTGSEYHYKATKFDRQSSEKLMAIMCTSDPNGKLKGVCISHTAILTYAEMKCRSMKEFRSLNFSSIHACVGIIGIFLSPFRPGETRISTNQTFTPKLCAELIEKYRVSVVAMPPIYLNALINSSYPQSGDFSSIVLFSCTGAVVTENLRDKFKKTFPNKPLLISYGTTEVFIAAMFPGEDNNGLKVGRTFTNIQLKIVDEEGSALDLGEVGEILVKPEFKFQGYYNSPESTEEVVDRDGFIKTGDIGFLDHDGYVNILDKNKNIFKYKENLITPSEIENIIEAIEGVESVCVIGIRDSKVTNLTAAVVVKKANFEGLNEHDILSTVAERLPHTKHLYGGVYFVDEMPIGINGRILRTIVQEIATDKYRHRLSL
ncbi:hypothetical protein ACKWTF_010682 [Chironomus riparius]